MKKKETIAAEDEMGLSISKAFKTHKVLWGSNLITIGEHEVLPFKVLPNGPKFGGKMEGI